MKELTTNSRHVDVQEKEKASSPCGCLKRNMREHDSQDFIRLEKSRNRKQAAPEKPEGPENDSQAPSHGLPLLLSLVQNTSSRSHLRNTKQRMPFTAQKLKHQVVILEVMQRYNLSQVLEFVIEYLDLIYLFVDVDVDAEQVLLSRSAPSSHKLFLSFVVLDSPVKMNICVEFDSHLVSSPPSNILHTYFWFATGFSCSLNTKSCCFHLFFVLYCAVKTDPKRETFHDRTERENDKFKCLLRTGRQENTVIENEKCE